MARPPRYMFVNRRKLSWGSWQSVCHHIETEDVWPTDRPHPDSAKAECMLKPLTIQAILWAHSFLKIDLSERADRLKGVRVYSKAVWTRIPRVAETIGVSRVIPGSICLKTEADEYLLRGVLAHELIHVLGAVVVDVEEHHETGLIIRTQQSGLTVVPTRAFLFVSEAVTETISREMLLNSSLERQVSSNAAYYTGVILLDCLLRDRANFFGATVDKLRRSLYMGYFFGSVKSLTLLGTATVRFLASLREENYSTNELVKRMKMFGLNPTRYRAAATSFFDKFEPYYLSSGFPLQLVATS